MAKKDPTPKKSAIVAAAEDVQNVIKLSPALPGMIGPQDGPWSFDPASGVTDEQLLEELKNQAGEIYYKHPEHGTDPLQEATFTLLLGNGALIEPDAPATVETAKEKAAREKAEAKAAKDAEKAVAKASKPAGTKKSGKPAGEKPGQGPGVIATLLEIMKASSKKEPVTKEQMLEKLIAKFPERNADSMKATINVQIPSRLAKEKNITIVKGDKGYFVQ